MSKTPDLSPYGKQLLKQVRGSERMVSTAHAKHWGIERPDSIFHALPEEFTQMILNLPEEILEMTEVELESLSGGISRQDRQVRINLWDAYEKANRELKPMDMEAVAKGAGLPSWAAMEQRMFQRPALLGWVMRMPAQYELQIREGLELGLGRLQEILTLPLQEPIVDKQGNVLMRDGKPMMRINTSIGLLVLQAFKLLDQRRHGGYTQKNVQINMEAGKLPENATLDSAELDKKLRELEDAVNGKPPEQEVKNESN